MAYMGRLPAKPKHDGVAAFFEAHFVGLSKVLEDYHQRIGKRWEGEELTYGQTLTPGGLITKLRHWKRDEAFRAALSQVCTIRD